MTAADTQPHSFQQRVEPWLLACFGAMIAGDREERNHRFLEESLELVQACGCTASEAHQLVDYVFGRAVGDPPQEVGGVMVTLAVLCLANGLDMHAAAEIELARIWTKVEAIRAKQAAKPKHSPLPQVIPTPSPDSGERMQDAAFLTRWYYAGSEDAEHWFVGGDTREAAIQAGRDHYDGEQEAFAISAGTPMRHQLDPFTDDVEGVINAFQNANEEMFGENGQGDPEVDWTDDQCRDLARRLNATFAEWAKDHGHDKAYMLDLSKGEIVPAQEASGQRAGA